MLRDNFALCISKLKGPYTENFCVCSDGKKVPVRGASGQVGIGCKNPRFCAAFRAPWAEALAKQRVYIGNIFSRDLDLWDSFPDHNDLVRGYILEKSFTDTNPNHNPTRLPPSPAPPPPHHAPPPSPPPPPPSLPPPH